MRIGEIIRLIRSKKGLSQKDMADKFDISQNYLSLIESEKKMPSLHIIENIASKLNVSKEALLFAISDVPKELDDNSKKDYKKLQDNICYLLIFDNA
jgi:transcriptional regulator with XRE-family HTH domain